jgi:integrase
MERTRYPGVYRNGKRYVAVASFRGDKSLKRGFETASAAKRWKARREQELRELRQAGTLGEDPTVSEVLDAHARVHDPDWRPNTKTRRSSLRRIHVDDAVGSRRVSELVSDRSHLRRLYASVSPSQARNIAGMLRAAFRWAVREELIGRDPTDLVKPPAYRRPEARYLDLEDVRQLREDVAGHELEGAVILGLAGLRAAEACFESWGDLVGNVLHVRGSTWGPTKTGRTRSLTLPAGEVATLHAFRVREAERLLRVGVRITDRTTILTDAFGESLKPAHMSAMFRAFARAHGIDATYHSLRHTAASLMLASGTDVRTVAGRLGHASATTTLATYSHLIGQADRDAAERLEALFSPST